MLSWLIRVEGERFDYETNMLIQAAACGIDFCQVGIHTVYQNAGSHYRALQDSVRIARLLGKALLKKHPGI